MIEMINPSKDGVRNFINPMVLVQIFRQGKFSDTSIGLYLGIDVLPKHNDSKIIDYRFEDYPILGSFNFLTFESNYIGGKNV